MCSMQLPSKLKIFLWCLAQQSLSTIDPLHHWHISPFASSGLSGYVDSWRHFLLECTMSWCVWTLADPDLVELISTTREPDAKRWIFTRMESIPNVAFVSLLVTLWAIWHCSLKAIHEQEFYTSGSMHAFVQHYLGDLPVCKPATTARQQHSSTSDNAARWIPAPLADYVKIKVDDGVSRSSNVGSVSAVCRDFKGNYHDASAMSFIGILDPTSLEAMACWEALTFATDLLVSLCIWSSGKPGHDSLGLQGGHRRYT